MLPVSSQFIRISSLPVEVLDRWFPFAKIRGAVLYSEATKLRSVPKGRLVDTFSTRSYGSGDASARATGTAAHHTAVASEISVDALAAVEAPLHPPSQVGHRESVRMEDSEVAPGGDGGPAAAGVQNGNPFRPQSTSQAVRASSSGVSSV
jgi:hypothetical protein